MGTRRMTVEDKHDVDHEDAMEADHGETAEPPSELTLLIVDDDRPFLNRLARAMEARGFAVTAVESVADGLAALESHPPAFAIIDMRLGDGNGIDVISELKAKRPDARGVILTGYANTAPAVTAVKLAPFDYLAKPADADEIYHTLMATQADKPDTGDSTMSADRVRWEHIQRVFEACDR